jgi:hypothetical protein
LKQRLGWYRYWTYEFTKLNDLKGQFWFELLFIIWNFNQFANHIYWSTTSRSSKHEVVTKFILWQLRWNAWQRHLVAGSWSALCWFG